VDEGRLAADFRRLPQHEGRQAMSFIWPAALIGLILLPIAGGLYILAQRRRPKYAARFTNLDLLANVVDKTPNWRRHVPAALGFLFPAAPLVVAGGRHV